MHTFSKKILLLVFPSLLLGSMAGCRGDAEKLAEKERELEELRQLAELDKREMENQYAQFALQYDELKKGIKDDSLIARLDAEQKRAESLLAELKRVKSSDAAEIRRLKKELETVRAVLRTYVLQVDSLQRLNQTLTTERDEARAQYAEATTQISNLNSERESLTEQVAIAAQLNATGIGISPIKKNGKQAKKTKDVVRFGVTFTITRNVTARAGNRNVYIRLMKPNQSVANPSGNFTYENRSIEYSATKTIEYTGEEQTITLYVPINEFLSPGNFTAYIFVDGQMVGSGCLNMEK
ncbi:MAG: hypothetical protein IIW61_03070 [Bacteroidaceae bacterium]|nr:hypothetical protein [Bacteroidaceae bacterium]